MPVRTYNSTKYSTGLPHDLEINGIDTIEVDQETFDRMSTSMTFVDMHKALHGRILTRDPICGVGELPPEVNPLEGHKLREKPKSENESPIRDPILLLGNLEEYNCLYTKRDLKCKEKEDRNIITLDGNLGSELDPLRPHGGRPRNFIQQEEIRNPITGEGEYRKEWDPIWKYEGRHYIKRPEQKKRDPVTHNVPAENMGDEGEKHHIRLYNNKSKRDPLNHSVPAEGMEENEERHHVRLFNNQKSPDIIKHDHGEDSPVPTKKEFQTGIRHYPLKEYRDPITHESVFGEPSENSWKPGTKHFAEKSVGNDPITHHGLDDDIIEMYHKQDEAREKAKERVIRDPITGNGVIQKEGKTLSSCANQCPFRSYLNSKKDASNDKPAAKPVKKKK